MATSKIESKADYVIEQGTSGIWSYRKWKSGLAECWAATSSGTSYTMSANGAIYSSDNLQINLPDGLFSDTPIIQMQTRTGGGMWVKVTGSSTKNVIVYQILRSNNSVGNIALFAYCIGS